MVDYDNGGVLPSGVVTARLTPGEQIYTQADLRRLVFIHSTARDAALRGEVLTADQIEALWQAHITSEGEDA